MGGHGRLMTPPGYAYDTVTQFKDQPSAIVMKKRFTVLCSKIKTTIQPVFISTKLNEDLKVRLRSQALVEKN